ISGVLMRGQDNNILTQVGFVVLIGLAAKNAILIVEFAKQLEDQGRDRLAAAVEAARLRLRPILMTSVAFIFGVMPLVWAIGAGAVGDGRGGGGAADAGPRRVRRHDRSDGVRARLYADLLRGLPLDRGKDPPTSARAGGAARAGGIDAPMPPIKFGFGGALTRK